MDVAIIGLGRMGSGVAKRLLKAGHRVVVYNRTQEKMADLVTEGAEGAASLDEVVKKLSSPRVIWLYLPAGVVVEEHIAELSTRLSKGDSIIDGGNSNFNDSVQRAAQLKSKGLAFVDVGTSGGIHGEKDGYCLMIGGQPEVVMRLNPLWETVAQEKGYCRVGIEGAGHYTKMVHNAIEYGMMQAYGEGMALLTAKKDLSVDHVAAAAVWQQGSIIRSFLGQLVSEAVEESHDLNEVSGLIDDSGEGQWAVQEGLKQSIPLPVITAALFARYQSRRSGGFDQKIVNILRKKFGGHAIRSH